MTIPFKLWVRYPFKRGLCLFQTQKPTIYTKMWWASSFQILITFIFYFFLSDGAPGLHKFGLICLPLILTVTVELTWISLIQPHTNTPPLQSGTPTHTHIHTHTSHTCTQAFSRPWLNLPCVHLWENLIPPTGGAPSYFCEKKKKKDPDGDDDNIADLKIRWNENNMLNMRKSTTLPSAPFHTDRVLFLFVFLLNLPVNQQRPVLWKSKKAFGVEHKSHVCGERR